MLIFDIRDFVHSHWYVNVFAVFLIKVQLCSNSYLGIRHFQASLASHFFHVSIGLAILIVLYIDRICKESFLFIGSLWIPHELGLTTSCHRIFTMIFRSKTFTQISMKVHVANEYFHSLITTLWHVNATITRPTLCNQETLPLGVST